MPQLRADLELQLEAALSALSDLDAGFEQVSTKFQSRLEDVLQALGDIPIQLDTSAAESAASDLVAQVEGEPLTGQMALDLGPAESSLTDIAAQADSTETQGTFDLDTSAAQDSLDEVSSKADDASTSVGGLDFATSSFRATSDLATGSAAGLGSAVGEMGTGYAAAAGAVTAGAGAVGLFFNEALDSDAVTRRFNQTLGEFASSVDNLHVGSLNTDISTLAIKLGSSDEQMRRSATNAFLFATNSGVAGQKAAEFASQVEALAARAVALNPDLGDVGDAAQSLQRALITGRERALLPFNLGLDKAAVAAKAMELATAAGRTEVTGIDKAMAAAQISADKFGSTLGETVAQGAENPTIKLRSLKTEFKEFLEGLGKPLVVPIFELLRTAIPAAEAAGRSIALLATSAIPVLANGMRAVEIPLNLVANILQALGPAIQPALYGFLAFKAVGFLPPLLDLLASGLLTTAVVAPVMGDAVLGAAVSVEAASATVEASLGPIGLLAAGIGIAAAALGVFGGSSEDARTDVEAFGKSSDASLTKFAQGIAAIQKSELPGWLKDGLGEKQLKTLKDVAEQNIGTAQRLGQAYVDAGVITQKQLDNILGNASKGQQQLSADQAASQAAISQTSAEQQRSSSITQAQTAAVIALTHAGAGNATQIQAQATAYAAASQAASDYKTRLDILNSSTLSQLSAEQSYRSGVLSLTQALQDNKGSLDIKTDAGNKDIAAVIQATQAAQGYAAAIVQAGGSQDAANASLVSYTSNLITLLQNAGASPAAIGTLLGQLGLVASVTDPGTRAILGLADAAATTLPTTGQEGVDAFGQALGTGLPAATKSAADAALEKLAPAAWALPSKMSEIGFDAGSNLDLALGYGIQSGSPAVQAIAKQMIRDIKHAMDNAGSPSEHLFFDSGVSHMGAYGDALEQAGAAAVANAEQIVRDAAAALTGGAGVAVAGAPGAGLGGAGGGDTAGLVQQLIAALAGAGGSSQIGPFHVSGSDPQATATLTAREVSFQQRFSGV